MRRLARHNARTVVAKAREVVIYTNGWRKGLAAICRPDSCHGPVIQRSSDEPVVMAEIVRLPDKGHRHHVATILVRTLAILELWIVGVDEGAIHIAGHIEVIALQRLAPAVVAACADMVRNALFDCDLKAVVVGVLIGADDEHVAIGRSCRRKSELRVQWAAIVDRSTRIGIGAGL